MLFLYLFFTPAQVSDENKYKSSNAIQFMVESLIDLDSQITNMNKSSRLFVTYSDEIDILKKIKKHVDYDAVYVNQDYTPYSIRRDKSIEKYCNEQGVNFYSCTDILLLDTNEITANNGNYYKVFTQFYNKTSKMEIRLPVKNRYTNYISHQQVNKVKEIINIKK